MTSVNYVIAGWSGSRACGQDANLGKRYIIRHINQLNNIRHNLTQITICNPANPLTQEHNHYLEILKELKCNGCKIEILDRKNEMVAYGSWSDAYAKYRKTFDYYILMEDDYVPVKDNFDSILINMLNDKKAGYLGAFLSTTSCVPDGRKHMGVTNGIASSEAMEAVFLKFGSLMAQYVEPMYWLNQINFSLAFLDAGFTLADWSEKFRVPFWYAQGASMMDFAPNAADEIIAPLEKVGGY